MLLCHPSTCQHPRGSTNSLCTWLCLGDQVPHVFGESPGTLALAWQAKGEIQAALEQYEQLKELDRIRGKYWSWRAASLRGMQMPALFAFLLLQALLRRSICDRRRRQRKAPTASR